MKIVKHLRQDAARLVGAGVVVGLSATSTLAFAEAAAPAQPDATAATSLQSTSSQSPSPLSRSIFASVAPAPTLSPELSAEINQQIATSLAHAPVAPAQTAEPAPAAPAAQVSPASLTHALPGQLSAAVRALPKDAAIAFEFPLPGHSVNSRFGLRQLSFEPRARMHDGVDIAAPTGSPIHATADGHVRRTGLSSSYGNFVEVAHADGLTSFYAHMSRTAGLEPGAKVSAGEVLGYVGSTGHSTGPHLHFEIRDDGKPLDPQAFLGRAFASAADLPLTQAHGTEAQVTEARAPAVFSHVRHRLHMLASWHGRERPASARYYAADHRFHARFAAG